jgi:preprotein translocase subunit SecF
MFVIKYRYIFFIISAAAIVASLFAIFNYKLNLGTDFLGGTIYEIEYTAGKPTVEAVRATAGEVVGTAQVQEAGENGYFIRARHIGADEKEQLSAALAYGGQSTFTEKRFSSIGPIIGQELARKGIIAISLVVVLIILFIAFAFRKVSAAAGGVSSWKYGVMALVALMHDLIIPTGIFAYLGATRGVEIDALFLTGLLTILGISIHDTIVIFDRIRENLRLRTWPHFEDTVGHSLSQTFTRSINTSMTIIIVLLILLFVGPTSIRNFSLLMAIGVFVGTYSSVFIAAPLLVEWQKRAQK